MAYYHHATNVSQIRVGGNPAKGLGRLAAAWLRHRRNRRELLQLDDAQMKDTGITLEAIREAINTPFWRL